MGALRRSNWKGSFIDSFIQQIFSEYLLGQVLFEALNITMNK